MAAFFCWNEEKGKKKKVCRTDRTQKRNRSEVVRKDLHVRKKDPQRQTLCVGQVCCFIPEESWTWIKKERQIFAEEIDYMKPENCNWCRANSCPSIRGYVRKQMLDCEEREKPTRFNNQMFIINCCLNMFRASLWPSSGEQRPCYCIWCTALVLLASCNAAPHNRYQPHPAEPEQYTICSNTVFVLLKMGIMMPETCWDRSW